MTHSFLHAKILAVPLFLSYVAFLSFFILLFEACTTPPHEKNPLLPILFREPSCGKNFFFIFIPYILAPPP